MRWLFTGLFCTCDATPPRLYSLRRSLLKTINQVGDNSAKVWMLSPALAFQNYMAFSCPTDRDLVFCKRVQGTNNLTEFFHEPTVVRIEANETLSVVFVFGYWPPLHCLCLLEAVLIPLVKLMCPIHLTSLLNMRHFFGFSFKFTAFSLANTACIIFRCSWKLLYRTITSSKTPGSFFHSALAELPTSTAQRLLGHYTIQTALHTFVPCPLWTASFVHHWDIFSPDSTYSTDLMWKTFWLS